MTISLDVPGSCANCPVLTERIVELESLLYPSSDVIPESAWNVFPESGSYIRRMLEYGGYCTRKSLANLQTSEQLENLFSFIRDMAEDMDSAEKKDLLGVFAKNPQKLRIIPGCAGIFVQFIQSNMTESECPPPSRAKGVGPSVRSESTVTSAGAIDESVTEYSVTDQLEQWLAKRSHHGKTFKL